MLTSCLRPLDLSREIFRIKSYLPAILLTSLCVFEDGERQLKSEIQNLWNQIWSTADTGAQTRSFFPSVEAAAILNSPLTPFFLCSFLSGQCVLNKFLFKIKRKLSPLCSCSSGDEEDINHVIFVCSNYVTLREKLSACASNLNLLWPVPFHAFAQHKPLWLALLHFLVATKRLKLQL